MSQVLRARTQDFKQEKERLLAQGRPLTGRRKNTPVDEKEMQRDHEKESLDIQVIDSTLLGLLEKIRRALQMPDLAATIDTLDQNLRQSEGLPSVRRAYEKAQKDIQAWWKLVEHWAGEMGYILAASDPASDSKSEPTHQSLPPLQLAPYSALLKQALHGHLQFLGNSQVHKLKQADFTGKLVTALRTRITEIGQQLQQDFEGWFARVSETIRHRLESSRGATLQEHQQTRDYLLSQLQTQEDKLNQLNQTLDAYFSALLEANGYD
jgi:hypothetical protein